MATKSSAKSKKLISKEMQVCQSIHFDEVHCLMTDSIDLVAEAPNGSFIVLAPLQQMLLDVSAFMIYPSMKKQW